VTTITVELTVEEARRLADVANLFGTALADVALEDPVIAGLCDRPGHVPPLLSAAMHLETALLIAGCEL
jgi:hypothetical protein